MSSPAKTGTAQEGAPAPSYDPVALAESLRAAAEKSAKVIGDFAARQAESGKSMVADELGIGKAFMELAAKMLANPYRLAEAQMNLWWEYMMLWQASTAKLLGGAAEPVAAPAKGDKRFRHEDWEEHFLFDYIKQSYLIAARWLHGAVGSVEGLDEATKRKVDFFTRQYIDALAPSNFALTNPEVFRETIATGGQNLVKGLHNLLDDIERGDGRLKISMTDPKAFELGVNIATTPGKVVFQNDLLQLIQYEPSTTKVAKRPLLVIPPWINKYYILDLREKNSFVKWAVDQGLTVFVISWVNPDERLAHKDFEDYLTEGTLAALDAVEKATGEKEINALGYCLGGTLLAMAAAVLARDGGDDRIGTLTLLAAETDFEEPGELGLFIDESQIAYLEDLMWEQGYLDGKQMAGAFRLLNSKDLVWSRMVTKYLMGEREPVMDLMAWNADATRMPYRMHSEYLRRLYLNNDLAEGRYLVDGKPVVLSDIRAPLFVVGTERDHVSPWRSVYKINLVADTQVTFLLTSGGHNVGVVNPPATSKREFRVATREASAKYADPDTWFAATPVKQGSWWPEWCDWLAARSSAKVAPPPFGAPERGLPPLDAAPGRYVQQT